MATAPRVPFGIDFAGFLRSPDRLDPAMMPVQAGKKIAIFVKKLESSGYLLQKFSH